MKKSLFSGTAWSAALAGIIIFLGNARLELRYFIGCVLFVTLCRGAKMVHRGRRIKDGAVAEEMPLKLRYRCGDEAEVLVKKLLRGVVFGETECHFCADYSQLSGYMVLKDSRESQKRYEANVASLSKGGSVLEIIINEEQRSSVGEEGIDIFVKDVLQGERI